MKLFACLAVASAANSSCSPGTSVGIDVNGDQDLSNTDECFPTKESAFVAHCNNQETDVAEMLMKIEKDLFESSFALAEFKLNADGTHYEHVIGFGGENTRASKTETDIELFYSVEDEASSATSQGHQIYLSGQKKIEFSCSYSLATQTISTELDVTGTDIEISRAATGQLVFDLVGSEMVNIGARYAFSIVPKTPGAVFYTIKNCQVRTLDESQSYGLIHDIGSGQCIDDIVDVRLDSTGWSTSGQQDFSFRSFKFNSPSGAGSTGAEAQKISCEIHLAMEFDADYNPTTCVASECQPDPNVEKTWAEAFPAYDDPMSYVDVDSIYNGYTADVFNGNGGWHSQYASGAWIKLELPEPTELTAFIIRKPTGYTDRNRYKNVCLHLNGGAYTVCTDAVGLGAPYLNENEIRFPIHPPSNLTSNKIELKWGAGSDNYGLVAQIKFEMPSDNCNRD